MIAVIGEALVDKFFDFERIGGAPLNFAVHVHHLGQPVRLITRVGRDAYGQTILKELTRRGLDTSAVQIDEGRPTGTVRVTLSDLGSPAFDILPDVAYDAIEPPAVVENIRLAYFGTLAQRSPEGFDRMQQFLSRLPEGSVRFLDLNLRPRCFTRASVAASLEKADVLKFSDDERDTLNGMLFSDAPQTDFLPHLMSRYAIDRILLTCGHRGASLFTRAGQTHTTPAAPVPHMIDSLGAGDAFAAVWAVGWMLQASQEKILSAAAAFAAHICGLAGALPSDLGCYRDVLDTLEGAHHE